VVLVLGPMLGSPDQPDRLPERPSLVHNLPVEPDSSPGFGKTGSGESTDPMAYVARNIEHTLTWNTVDQGTVYLDDERPLRSVVRQAAETVSWYDPARKAHVELTIPRDEVMLVEYGSQ
jgi:hypothetical protein